MTIEISALRPEDIEAVHQILLSAHTIRGTMRLPHQSLDYTRKRFEPADGVFTLAARSDDRVVGFSEMVTYPNIPRHRHTAEINFVATHEQWQGQGVGRALMEAMIDLADNWLNLTRLGLIVWTTNEPAVHLYQNAGLCDRRHDARLRLRRRRIHRRLCHGPGDSKILTIRPAIRR